MPSYSSLNIRVAQEASKVSQSKFSGMKDRALSTPVHMPSFEFVADCQVWHGVIITGSSALEIVPQSQVLVLLQIASTTQGIQEAGNHTNKVSAQLLIPTVPSNVVCEFFFFSCSFRAFLS